jgi:hypothetical protein
MRPMFLSRDTLLDSLFPQAARALKAKKQTLI